MSDIVTEVQRDTFRDHPVIRLPNGSQYGLTFGLSKARAFVAHQEAVREWMAGDPITDPDVTTGTYRKKPTISLPNGSRYGFTFGRSKAETILQYAADVVAFVEDHQPKASGPTRANGLDV